MHAISILFLALGGVKVFSNIEKGENKMIGKKNKWIGYTSIIINWWIGWRSYNLPG